MSATAHRTAGYSDATATTSLSASTASSRRRAIFLQPPEPVTEARRQTSTTALARRKTQVSLTASCVLLPGLERSLLTERLPERLPERRSLQRSASAAAGGGARCDGAGGGGASSGGGECYGEGHDVDTQRERARSLRRSQTNILGLRGDEEWLQDETRLEAMSEFRERHTTRSSTARGLLSSLETLTSGEEVPSHGFRCAVVEVARNRLLIDLTRKPVASGLDWKGHSRKKKVRRRWRMDDSIWLPRKTRGNSKDYYETDASRGTVFETDWEIASVGVANLFRASGKRATTAWARAKMAADGKRIKDEVKEILWQHHHILFGAFDYYCCLFDTGKDAHGEVDAFMMSYKAYTSFARDCRLGGGAGGVSIEATEALDLIWITVNALPGHTPPDIRALDRWNHPRKMNHHQWLQAIIHIANSLFVPIVKLAYGAERGGSSGGASGTRGSLGAGRPPLLSALSSLCTHLEAALPPEAKQDSNVFRRARCYHELTDMVLRQHQQSLEAIFRTFAKVNKNQCDELLSVDHMSIGEWLSLVTHCGLLDSSQVSYVNAKLIFKWSLIRARPDHSAASERQMRHLTFVDFLEALVRLACTMALPTDAELEAAMAEDAGEYLQALEESGGLEGFVHERKVEWHAEPRQHASRCVSHLISLLVRVVQHDITMTHRQSVAAMLASRQLSEDDVIKFVKRRQHHHLLHTGVSKAGLIENIKASSNVAQKRLFNVMRTVEVFDALSDEQIETLCTTMSHVRFAQDTYVFEQGDVGDVFYIITEGKAEVLRTEPGLHEEVVLGTLAEGAHFGERALLKNQVRYAGVRADTNLYAVFITRADLERALGTTLERLVPDQYKLDEAELLTRLSAVPLLQALSTEELQTLADHCTEVKFGKGTDVVRQGEGGDAFYVVTKGTAKVLRWPELEMLRIEVLRRNPKELASLGPWDAFGERALLTDERRYASVRVTSDELTVMTISRHVLERTLGSKLHSKDPQAEPLQAEPQAEPKNSQPATATRAGTASDAAATPPAGEHGGERRSSEGGIPSAGSHYLGR
jgi:CRP-like cAMP-binding protein